MVEFGCRIEMGVAEYETTLRQARLAESHNYDSVWARDHVAIPEVTNSPYCLETFVTLAGLARETTRVKLGTLVVCTPWRNPALIAKMSATIDVMAGGRLYLGLGAGALGLRREFDRYGFPVASNAARIGALGEAIQIIRAMWTEPAPSFQGKYHTIQEAVCEPKPKLTPLIWIGASGEQLALKNVARHADGWNSTAGLEDYARKAGIVNSYCEAIGRDPATLRRSVNQLVIVDRADRAKARLEALMAARPGHAHRYRDMICGEPEYVAERIRPFLQYGADTFITYFWETDPNAQCENIEAFGSEVIPLFR